MILAVGFNVVKVSIFSVHNNISIHIDVNIIIVNVDIDFSDYGRGLDYNLILLLALVIWGYFASRYNLSASLITSDLGTPRLLANFSS